MLAAVLICSVSSGCDDPSPIRAGDEFFAIADYAVTRLTLRSERVSVVARKARGTAQFAYEYQQNGQRSVRCGASPARDRALREAFAIRAENLIAAKDKWEVADLPRSRRIELEVQSIVKNEEPFRLLLLQPVNSGQAWVEAYLPETGTGLLVRPDLLRLLDLACKR